MAETLPPTSSTPESLVSDIQHWGNLQWQVGYISWRAFDRENDSDLASAQLDAENELQESRYSWAQLLLDLCENDPEVTDEQQNALFAIIDSWGGAYWLVGWNEAQHVEKASPNPMEGYAQTEIQANFQVWKNAVTALVESLSSPTK